MICTSSLLGFGVEDANAGMARTAGTFRAPAAHVPTHAGWAVAAIAPQRKRRTAAATLAFVNRGFV